MPEQRRRVAGVDIGSNTVRLMVADVAGTIDSPTIVERLAQHGEVTRLGEQVERRGILLPEAIARTRNVLVDYRLAAERHGAVAVLATATSAVRDADNGEAFLGEVEYSYGFRTRLLSGADEAATSWAGATSDPELAQRTRTGRWALVDIGGGSTEIVVVEDGIVLDHHSFQLGCVRLTERFLDGSDPPDEQALAAARTHIRGELQTRFSEPAPIAEVIGVAGTCTTLVARNLELRAYDADLVHLQQLAREDVEIELRTAASLPAFERAQLPGMEPRRAPVILAGYCIAAEVLLHFGSDSMLASERDILDGITLEAYRLALREGLEELPVPHGRTPC